MSTLCRYAPEIQIRDYYAENLRLFRKGELLIHKEKAYKEVEIRSDMRTIDEKGVIREWEFKKEAEHTALGQVLAYMAQTRKELGLYRRIDGVIAAFEFKGYLFDTIAYLNLNVELVELPSYLDQGGVATNIDANFNPVEIPESLRN